MHWTAIVNPLAGRRGGARDLARLEAALAGRGVDIRVTGSAPEAADVARGAFTRGDGVLACGGDGTVQVLADVAVETGGLLGVVPVGAGNDFARALGHDHRNPVAALSVLDAGTEARVDVGRATAGDGSAIVFTTVAHSGLDGEVNRWANTVTWASGQPLYAMAALRTMATYTPTEMRITVDGDEWSGRPWLVAVANTYCYGGGMRIAPDARVDDGRLDVIIVSDVSRAALVAKFPRMIRGTHLGIAGVTALSGTSVTVDGPPEQEIYASGERVGTLPARIEVVPTALRVLIPEGAPVS